ncbi:hypothetical protein Pmani_009647 [Petrolisthes manimaculis]|uniref:Gustatory receptor n=1 Tax=Petrolisthes manimaculis TaxID=1843537 RepID=A0AAE1UDF5_9EUCA|nr:hypothetical protein Pmani_009647 [Petrolisthes manimaculis]
MGCICTNLIFVLTSVLRLFGAFPYRWKSTKKKNQNNNKGVGLGGGSEGKLELHRSILAVMWSWIIVMGLVTFSLSCIINAPRRRSGITSTITIHILNYVSYLTSAILFAYLSLSSVKLARIFGRLGEVGVCLRKPLVQRDDAMELLCGFGMILGIILATYFSIRDVIIQPVTKSIALYQIPALFLDFSIETTASCISLLIYLLLKLVSIEIKEAVETLVAPSSSTQTNNNNGAHHTAPAPSIAKDVTPLSSASSLRWGMMYPRPPTPPPATTVIQQGDVLVDEEDASGEDDSGGGSYGVPQSSQMCRVSRRLLALDDIVVDMVEYAGLPTVMILLASTVNATVMLYLTITGASALTTYYIAYITTKVLSVVQVAFIPDCLSTQVGLRDVERILVTGAKFLVCRLFTLDRHIILSVASSVVTYLVIALQFGLSEKSGDIDATTTNLTTGG